jgi:hypothetical protein
MAGRDPWLSGLILLSLVHGIDSTGFQAFGDKSEYERSNAVRRENSIFHGRLKAVALGRVRLRSVMHRRTRDSCSILPSATRPLLTPEVS